MMIYFCCFNDRYYIDILCTTWIIMLTHFIKIIVDYYGEIVKIYQRGLLRWNIFIIST